MATPLEQRIQPTRTRVTIFLDTARAIEIDRLTDALEDAEEYDAWHNEPDTAPAIEAQIAELATAAADSEEEFVFVGLPHWKFTELERAHPPTAEQKARGEETGIRPTWHDRTFIPALLAATCESHPASEGYDEAAWDRICNGEKALAYGQIMRLFRAAMGAQTGVTEAPKAPRPSPGTSDSAPR